MQYSLFRIARPVHGDARLGTLGTLILAAASALLLVLMSGCHSTPVANGFVSTAADKTTEQRLRQPDTMAALQPFDEHFVVETPDAN